MMDLTDTSNDRVFGENAKLIYAKAKSIAGNVRAALVNNIHYLTVDKKFDAQRGAEIYPPFLKAYRDLIYSSDSEDDGSLAPSNVSTVRWALRPLPLDPKTASFVDLGSGTGRALLVAARLQFQARHRRGTGGRAS